MVKILGIKEPYGARIQKKFGKDWELLLQQNGDFLLQEDSAKIRCELGWPEFLCQQTRHFLLQENGDKIKFDYAYAYGAFGIYQLKNCREGKISCKEKFYNNTVPATPNRLVCRGKFADAVAGWQALTTPQKAVYNKRAVGKHMSGYNLFIREFMLT